MREKIAPTTPATNKEIQGVAAPSCSANSRLKTTPEKAPITIIPSRPTLTTPPRSEKTPPILVKISGAEYISIEETKRVSNVVIDILTYLL